MSHIIERESTAEIRHPHVEVPIKSRFFWGMGGFTDASITYGTVSLISVIYINAWGYAAALIGFACAVPRLFDALSDPVVGHLSDNTRTRWGRRRPWMFAGLIISALIGLIAWYPPTPPGTSVPRGFWALLAYSSTNVTFWYLAVVMSALYAVGYTFFNVPHLAMGYEMTTDYNERTHLFKWRQVMFAAAGFLTPWLLPLCMALEGAQAQQWKGSHGVIPVSYLVGIVILLTGLPSVLFCKEKVEAHQTESRVRFLEAVKLTLRNGPFWLLMASNFITKFLMSLTGIFFVYVFIYHIANGQQAAGTAYVAIFFNSINIANLFAMPVIAKLSDWIGKRACLLLMLTMSAAAYASLWFTMGNTPGSFLHLSLPTANILSFKLKAMTLSMQWPCLLTGILIGIFTNTMPMIKNSMLADVCDLDEQRSGHRREAFYGAVFTGGDKLALFLALAFQGFLLTASGFNSQLELQSAATIACWFKALVITQPAACLIALTSIFFYPLTRDRVHAIRAELDSRNTAATGTDPLIAR